MRRLSLLANGNSLSIERTECGDLLRRRWLNATLRRIILPEPVILTRFDIALCVFSFCFITLLSVYLLSRGTVRFLTLPGPAYEILPASVDCNAIFCKSVCLGANQCKADRTNQRRSLVANSSPSIPPLLHL